MTETLEVQRECWCGSSRALQRGEFDIALGRFPLVQCAGCGVIALHPQPDEATLARAYSTQYYGVSKQKFIGPFARIVTWFQNGRARMAQRIVRQAGVQARPRVLDIGCGNGGFLMQMHRRGFEIQGTERTAESAARVPAEIASSIHIGDLLALRLAESSFDLVTLWHVFEHLRDPVAHLREIKRLLKPGGRLMLALPNAESAQARRFGTHWLHHDPPRHLYGFGPHSLDVLLGIAEFEQIKRTTFSLEQNPFGWIQSLLNSKGYPRDRLYESLKVSSQSSMMSRAGNLAWLALLAVPGIVISSIESARGEGATMTVVTRPRT